MTRRTTILVAAVVIIGIALYVWTTGRPLIGPAASDGASQKPVALPDLTGVDPAVQQQVRDQHAALERVLGNREAPAADAAEAFGSLGKVLLASEYTAEAETAFLNAQSRAPSDMRWPYYLGHVYRAREEPARAIPMFERALSLAPNDVPSLVWLADLHTATGNAAAAEPYLQRAAALQPESAAVVSRLGRAALAARDYRRAIEHLEGALRMNPDAASLHYPLGMAYRGAGQTAQAEAHLRQASDSGGIAPADPLMEAVAAVLKGEGAFESRGMQALEARDWKAAVENLGQAVALAPRNAIMRLNLGTALSLSGDTAGARRELLEAVRLSPELSKAHFALALLAQDEGRWDEAIERLSEAVRHDSGFADAHFALAEALRRTGAADRSLSHYTRVLQLNEAASQARFGYAMALVRLGRHADARTALVEAAQLHPDQPGFPHALARILAAAPDAQIRDGRRALELMQPLAAQPGAAVSETMAMIFAELGRFDEAVDLQQRAIGAARQSGQSALAARMQDNLDLYRRRQPCRTPWRDDDPVIAIVARGER
jgi:tetratricopeptide (TPR) repeat protein